MTLITDPLVERVIGYAIEVHRTLGPGLLESTYRRCLRWEFTNAGLAFLAEQPIPVIYKGSYLDCGYRADFVVEDRLLLEIKSVDHLIPVHEAQMLTYLKLLNYRQGLLINFNVTLLSKGVKSLLNGSPVPAESHQP